MQQGKKETPIKFYLYWAGVAVIAGICWLGMPIWLGALLSIVWLIVLVCLDLALDSQR